MSTGHTHARLLFLLLGCSAVPWYWTQVVSTHFSEYKFVDASSVDAYTLFLATFTYTALCSALFMFSCDGVSCPAARLSPGA